MRREIHSNWWGFDKDPHPEYSITEPNGCEGCISLDVEFTPNATPSDVTRITELNFSCMARWAPCTVESDILPMAWKQYRVDTTIPWRRRTLCDYPIDMLLSDLSNVVLAQVSPIAIP
jgi:hypothetical protein